MSHYQDNINAPRFPPGVHMSHYSLANTTLIGQEVQQRLWEKYWGQPCPVPTMPYMWYHPGICYHGYPYGIPLPYNNVSTHAGLVQSQQPVISQRNKNGSSNDNYDKISKSCHGEDVILEVLAEGNSWHKNTGRTSKHANPKTVDPVVDDLDWNMFSSDLADGIAVSILDSFTLELPLLDLTLVQSVLQEIDEHLPQPDTQVQPCSAKQEYFQEIEIFPQTQWPCNEDKTFSCTSKCSDESYQNAKKLENYITLHTKEEINKYTNNVASRTKYRSSSGLHTIGKTFREEDFYSTESETSPENSSTSLNETAVNCNSTNGKLEQIKDQIENTL